MAAEENAILRANLKEVLELAGMKDYIDELSARRDRERGESEISKSSVDLFAYYLLNGFHNIAYDVAVQFGYPDDIKRAVLTFKQ
jgi:hypothetical protein